MTVKHDKKRFNKIRQKPSKQHNRTKRVSKGGKRLRDTLISLVRSFTKNPKVIVIMYIRYMKRTWFRITQEPSLILQNL